MLKKLLIANRGEIAIRLARTAREAAIPAVMIYSQDDAGSLHVSFGDEARMLEGRGAAAYLDIEQVIAIAVEAGCDAVHPGYGFLSENAAFARRCDEAGLTFVGPRAQLIELFGDKTRARALATECSVPVVEGTDGPAGLDEFRAFLDQQGPGGAIMIKAVAGGGGRGMRPVESPDALESAYKRCQSEARRSFGDDTLYAERLIRRARHIEVQIVGDGNAVCHLWERDCTLQRQNQKLVEVAPAPGLDIGLRDRLLAAATTMASRCGYDNIGTFEFLVDLDRIGQPGEFAFIEANPRLQVEHTVTEEVTGWDLVMTQLRIASGESLTDIGLAKDSIGPARGTAIQLRINMESMDESGAPRPATGCISAFDVPGGLGVRVDTFGFAGYQTVASFDSLIAKLIVHSAADFAAAVQRCKRSLAEFRIDGLSTNIGFLEALLTQPEVMAYDVTTGFTSERAGQIVAAIAPRETRPGRSVLDEQSSSAPDKLSAGEPDWQNVEAAMTGMISSIAVSEGDSVAAGQEIAVLEAMKMEHGVAALVAGVVRAIRCTVGDQVCEGASIFLIEPLDQQAGSAAGSKTLDLEQIRPELAQLRDVIAATLDEGRPKSVEKRRSRGQRTARENVMDLLDEDSFVEYGQLTVAYRHSRHTVGELREMSAADGFVMGIGTVNADQFGPETGSVAVGSYDATVVAGTQGHMNHKKTDRLCELAGERNIPLVLFAEGGGGRPGDDPSSVAGLHTKTFYELAKLSGKVPILGIVSGRCFAGNAALLGIVDTIIATDDSTIGMAGPALIEAAGLGAYAPEEVGPADLQSGNGVIDIRVADEAEAVAVAKQYLGYFQGTATDWQENDLRLLRHAIPENRLRAYDVREVGELIADAGAWLELRAGFGLGYVTALIRVEGRPMGVIANNPAFNAGAIDSDGADKAARFLRLCDAHGLPVLSLIDTPGIMVGNEAEATALVRHSARLFATAASLNVPVFALILRKAYGLGAMAAAGGHFHRPFFTIAWPTGELGGMGLEGAVRLSAKHELEAIEDSGERQAYFEKRVAALYEKGKATNAAAYFELDAVIDPADTRSWIVRGLDATAGTLSNGAGRFIDTW